MKTWKVIFHGREHNVIGIHYDTTVFIQADTPDEVKNKIMEKWEVWGFVESPTPVTDQILEKLAGE